MKQFKFIILLAAVASALFSACTPWQSVEYEQKNRVVILNQGNYTAQDASVYIYDEDTKEMTVNAYSKANNNTKLGATLMSGTYSMYGLGYLLCSNPDKIEVVNILTMQTLSNPIKEQLLNTREITLGGEYIFVTNAGNDYIVKEDGSYEYTNSYLSIYNISNNSLKDTIHVGSDAHGVVCWNSSVFVGTKDGIVEIDYDGTTFKKAGVYQDEEFNGTIKQLITDNTNIYASVPGHGIFAYDPSDNKTRKRYARPDLVDNITGHMTMGPDKCLYTYATTYSPDDWSVENSNVFRVNLQTDEITHVYNGEYVYGVGVSPYSGNIFIPEANELQTNSTIYINHPTQELLVDRQIGGIGTFKFLFVSTYEEKKETESK